MNIRPLHDRVVVRRVEKETKSDGGIVIPDSANTEKPSRGEVIAVGPGKRSPEGKLTEPSVKAGDKILFGKYSGTEVKLEGDDFIVMREDDIMGVFA